jgi:hypothetical protein
VGGACSTHRVITQTLFRRALGWPMYKWDNNVKMDVNDTARR